MGFAREAGAWQGTASALLDALNATAGADTTAKTWPTNAKSAGDRVRRHAPAQRQHGVAVDFRKSNGVKLIELAAEERDGGPLSL